jgi:hypothetical protein
MATFFASVRFERTDGRRCEKIVNFIRDLASSFYPNK